MALNHETGQREQKRVRQTFQRTVDHLRILEVRGEDGSTQTIKTTDEHPFWVPAADEYVEAKHLTPGTKLTGANGHFITVTSTRHEPHPEGVTVYNVEVDGFHNYFVAANGYRGPPVLAHNACSRGTRINDSISKNRLFKKNLNRGKSELENLGLIAKKNPKTGSIEFFENYGTRKQFARVRYDFSKKFNGNHWHKFYRDENGVIYRQNDRGYIESIKGQLADEILKYMGRLHITGG